MILRAASLLGGPRVRTLVVTAIALLLGRHGKWRQARLLVVVVGGVGLVTTGVKMLVERQRPTPLRGVRQAGGYSFPSGHSSGTLALCGTLAYLYWDATERQSSALLLGAMGAAATGLIGYSRVALRHHHTGDVIGGYALAASWLALILREFGRRRAPRGRAEA